MGKEINIFQMYIENDCKLGFYVRRNSWHPKRFAKVVIEFEKLIKNAQFQYVFLSYNNEGLMSVENVRNIMQKYGKYDLYNETDY
jgi:adenine-specific DNA methylase